MRSAIAQRASAGAALPLARPAAPLVPCSRVFLAQRTHVRMAAGPEGTSTEQAPATPSASPSKQFEELPPWVRREKERELQAAEAAKGGFKLPWGLALLFSTFTAIAATGSIFEYNDRNPIFGVIQPDSPLWAPILLFMAVTGYPMAGFLFKYGVDGFNEDAERQDRLDGYIK